MNKKKMAAFMGGMLLAVSGITACNKTGTTSQSESDHTKAVIAPSGSQNPDKLEAEAKDSLKPESAKPMRVEQQLPQIAAAQEKIDLMKMPDNTTICTVESVPITVGEYRRQFKMQAEQTRAQLGMNVQLQSELIQKANAMQVTLSDKEKQGLATTARKALQATGNVLKKYLADNHMTEQQFDQQIYNVGLAEKTACAAISHELLGELIDRELLCSAGRAEGLAPQAFNRYTELKKDPQFQQMLKSQLMTQDQMKDEVLKTELMQLMIKKIQESAPASDKQVTDFYQKNLDKFKHGDRIKLSQIFVAAPTEDTPAGQSIKSQLHATEPKLSQAELDAKAKATEEALRKRADDLLARALKGENFAKLADENTDDVPVRAAKLGGDMGYQDKNALLKEFSDKVGNLKAGTVYDKVIQSKLGYHIVKVTDQQRSGVLALSEVKDILRQSLTENNATMAVANWLSEKRKSSQIKLSPEFQQLVASEPQKPIKPSAD
jgi:parvulin-like peptidyl-prolyl isomerase